MRSLILHLTFVTIYLSLATAAPSPAQDPNRDAHDKRQATENYSDLLVIASEAGIPIPTDNPALLLSIAPIAAELNSVLPTAPVLSVLETAVPSGFLSQVVHNPSFAASFVSDFEAGNSPSWFLALPTSVREYLHTYNNYASIVTAVGGIQSVESVASSESVSSVSASLASAAASGSQSGSAPMTGSATGTSGSMASSSGTATGTTSGSASGASDAATGSSTGASSSSSAGAAAARETGALAAGAVAMAGILGLAVAL